MFMFANRTTLTIYTYRTYFYVHRCHSLCICTFLLSDDMYYYQGGFLLNFYVLHQGVLLDGMKCVGSRDIRHREHCCKNFDVRCVISPIYLCCTNRQVLNRYCVPKLYIVL